MTRRDTGTAWEAPAILTRPCGTSQTPNPRCLRQPVKGEIDVYKQID